MLNWSTKTIFPLRIGEEFDKEAVKAFYTGMCKDISKERKRMGGDFVVAQAVPSREFRDHIRQHLDSDLIFVVLHMSKEDQSDRIKQRHSGHGSGAGKFVDMLAKLHDVYDCGGEDEPNTITITVTKDMSRDDVVKRILESLPK